MMRQIKDFFKPTLAKVLLFIFIFAFGVKFLELKRGAMTMNLPRDTVIDLLFQAIGTHSFRFLNIFYTNLFVGLALSYLLSCGIVTGYLFLKRKLVNY